MFDWPSSDAFFPVVLIVIWYMNRYVWSVSRCDDWLCCYVCRSLDDRVISHTERSLDGVTDSPTDNEPRATSTPRESLHANGPTAVKAVAPEGSSNVKPLSLNHGEGISAPTRLVARRDRRVELSPPPPLEEPSFLINFSYHELEVRR